MRRLIASTRGASALEFALFAPMVILGLLVMTDIGIAVGTRMELDRNVRAGAQAAMSLNNDEAAIEAIVLASAGAPDDIDIDVTQTCVCGGTAADCTLACVSGDPPSVFFAIRATRPQPGIILGERTIASETRVQIR
jgi:uncharacterized membrane protein